MSQPPYGPPNGEPADPSHPQGPPAAGGQQPPPPPQPYGQTQYGQPQYSPQPYGQPQPGQPQYGQPQQPGQPQYGQAPYGQPQPGQPQPGQPAYGQPAAPPPAKPKRRARLVAGSAVALVVLAGGGVATYLAVSDSSSSEGAASPKQAVQQFADNLNNADFIGMLDGLAPGERSAISAPFTATVNSLKRLNVLSSSADPKDVAGIKINAQQLTFSDQTIVVNDHVQIVQLTGGTLDISANATQLPLSKDFLDAAFPHGLPEKSGENQRIDIAEQIREHDGKPIRIATEKVDGGWYPSLFYTIADNAANGVIPSAADAVAAKGADSAQNAVKAMINALLAGDFTTAVQLISPDELPVLHDYAGLILKDAPHFQTGMEITDLQLTSTSESDGAVRVGLKSLTLATPDDSKMTITIADECFEIGSGGRSEKTCPSDLIEAILQGISGFSGTQLDATSAQTQALANLLNGVTNLGVFTSQTDGQWYINPVRTVLELGNGVLAKLQNNDILTLIGFFEDLG